MRETILRSCKNVFFYSFGLVGIYPKGMRVCTKREIGGRRLRNQLLQNCGKA